jgi:[ribosomal protein S18]-alanine N-acetyltransferase
MKTQEQLRIHICWAVRRHMPEILTIERNSFQYPWFEEDFIRAFRQRNCIGMVAEHGERIVGFMVYELHSTRLHVLNFAVHPEWRYRSIGRQMFNKLVGKLSTQKRTRITMEIRETNLDALEFFKACGCLATAVLRNFFEDSTDEDAIVMEWHLEQEEESPIRSVAH